MNINNLPYSDMYFNTDRQLRCFKETKLMDMILDKCIFQISFINFSNICCWYTLELPHGGNFNVHLQPMSIQLMSVFHHIRFFTNFSTTFLCFSVMSM